MKKLIEFLGLRRSIVGLLGMVILVGMGEKMAERFLPLYLITLGSGLLWPGFLNALDNFLSALYSFPGGWLADRVGVKKSLLVFNLLAVVGFGIVVLIPRWEAVIVGSFLFLSWTAISLPASMELVNTVLPKSKHVMGVSLHSLVRRIPMAIGPIIGGLCIDYWGTVTGIRMAFLAAIGMALIALAMQQILIPEDKQKRELNGQQQKKEDRSDHTPWGLLKSFSPQLKRLLISDIFIRFCEQLPYAYIVVWCVEKVQHYPTAQVTATQFGILTAIEMTTAVLCYLPVAWLADRGQKKPYVLITFVNFTMFPLILFFSRSFAWLVVAFIVRGLKEFGEPTRKTLIMELAPEGKKAAAFGAYYLFRDVIVSVSAFVGAFLWKWDPMLNFLAAFGTGLIGTLWFAFTDYSEVEKK